MRWTYLVTESDKDKQGNWHPRLIWEDGSVNESAGRICGGLSLEQAKAEVAFWSARAYLTPEQQESVLRAAMKRNPNLTKAW